MFRIGTRKMLIVAAALALVAAACTCGGFDLGNLTGGTSGGGGITGGGGSGACSYDGGDGLTTNCQGTLAVGGSATGNLGSLFEADNYTFTGSAGQSVTIHVTGIGDTDPRVKLIDPSGSVIAENDDTGSGYDSEIVTTLPSAGEYAIRVDVFSTGDYQITLN